MEFDIGNVLYIIITLVAVTVGLLGKKKKPSGQGTGEPGVQKQPGFLENLEKAFNMGQQEQPIVNLSEYEDDLLIEEEDSDPLPEQGSEELTLMQEYEQLLAKQKDSSDKYSDFYITDSDMNTDPLEIVELEETDDEGTDYFEVVKDFDAGTAVVYSAIINRVDY